MSVIQLGPFLLKTGILLFIISAMFGYGMVKFRLNRIEETEEIGYKYANALIIGVLVWKGTFILFDPIAVFHQPSSLLYFDGGDKGILLGVITAALYLGYLIQSKEKKWLLNVDLIGIGLLAACGAFHLLQSFIAETNTIYHLVLAIWSLGLLGWYEVSSRKTISLNRILNGFMLFSIGHTAALFLSQERTFWVASFSLGQVIWLVLFVTAWLVSIQLQKRPKSDGGE